jgi:hypothetical protein
MVLSLLVSLLDCDEATKNENAKIKVERAFICFTFFYLRLLSE